MKVVDPGHRYELTVYDGSGSQPLVFMKREGEGYPHNVGHYPGTNCQEVIRALVERVKYLDWQIPCAENAIAIAGLRSALFAFEIRAARRHGRELTFTAAHIETAPTCAVCGHIDCHGHARPATPAISNTGEKE